MEQSSMSVLLVEDNPGDARLIRENILGTGDGLTISTATRLADALSLEREQSFDVMLLDLSLPDSEGLDTLRNAQIAAPHMAIVVLTGLDDEATAVAALREGAQDYLIKGQSDGPILARALRYAWERKRALEERENLIAELQLALATVKKLSGMLPICSRCKRVRNDAGYWSQIEEFLNEHSEARLSHSICPECVTDLYHDLWDEPNAPDRTVQEG